ncbi:phage holin family protein (plasmid) [Arsenophonus nasoniae]|uniref:Bacteriophage holin family HP1 n=1 Tax=Arsenophonus nasoniae TaxID=638 RepID=A0A4P7L328_9GAMM|nr:phage holin family protein [Arsenophonus nasoniae]QBY47001.1 Bacteriophage holin family HP1 [Arsenophonus nasoniae]WGM18521.1 phage holin family protein [Arsenophonus nasoniae]
MFEKYATPSAYLCGVVSTGLGFFTLDELLAVTGILGTIGTFFINLYYKRKEYRLKERQTEQ